MSHVGAVHVFACMDADVDMRFDSATCVLARVLFAFSGACANSAGRGGDLCSTGLSTTLHRLQRPRIESRRSQRRRAVCDQFLVRAQLDAAPRAFGTRCAVARVKRASFVRLTAVERHDGMRASSGWFLFIACDGAVCFAADMSAPQLLASVTGA